MNAKFGIRGDLNIILRDEHGVVIDSRSLHNTIVDVGYDFICDVIGNTSQPADMHYTAIGTGTTGVTGGDTTLTTEVVRVANVYAHTPGTKIFTHTANYSAGVGTGAITESSLVNAATVGTMLNRVVFDVINKGSSDTLEIEWIITLS